MTKILRLDTQEANRCFGCGGNNEAGMRLVFDLDFDARRIRGRFVLGANYAGGGGFAHGGIIAVVLDEAMGKISKLTEETAVTAEMNVVFRKPVPVDKEIVVEGWQEEEKGRNRFRVGEIRDSEGNLLARGTARFVAIDKEHFERVRVAQ
ncbi:MAG TPA: PaaI family thioesterase [Candidatus Acidoferrum sp.]|jgi:acyl-coenzyme A thioesterase PaaI-like protein|nr:PaaI family thioesterase [Candidatus Acidoferrum sp.]